MLQKLYPFVSDLQEASALLSGAVKKLEGVHKIDTVQVMKHFSPLLFCLKPASHLQSKFFINKYTLFLCKDDAQTSVNMLMAEMIVCESGCAAVHWGAGSSNEGCAGRRTIGQIAKGRRSHAGEAEEGNWSEVTRLWTEPVNTRVSFKHFLLILQIILKVPDAVNHLCFPAVRWSTQSHTCTTPWRSRCTSWPGSPICPCSTWTSCYSSERWSPGLQR